MNYINGKFVVEPFSEGILYGTGAFETILVEGGAGRHLEEHYKRLLNGCRVLEINFDMSYPSFLKQLKKFMERNPRDRYALRVSVSKKSYTYDFMINTREVRYTEEDYSRGFRLKVGTLLKNPTSPLTYVKSLCYTDNLISLRGVKERGYDEVVHLNFAGEVCEGAVSNIFLVKEGVVKTPEIACGLLGGIMRKQVIQKLREAGIGVEEGRYSLTDLLGADEVFITNSLMGVMPVREVEGIIKSGRDIYEVLKGI